MFNTDATSLPWLMQCLGSVNMSPRIPANYDTTARDEGNAADWLAEEIFDGRLSFEIASGQIAKNGVTITPDMVAHVRSYLGALNCGAMQVVTTWSDGPVMISGRADHISYDAAPNTLDIDDLKYGYRLIEPDMNWTLISHAIGYCAQHDLQPTRINLRIHQPRPHHPDGPLREWSLSYDQLMTLRHQIVKHLTSGDTELRTGKNCVTCDAMNDCPAARMATMNALDICSVAYSDDLTPVELSSELDLMARALDMVKSRRDALLELATYQAKNGVVIPMYGLEDGLSNRKWKQHASAELVTMLTGIKATKPAMFSPNELEQLGASPEIIATLTERTPTPSKLVRSDITKRATRMLKKGK